MRIILVVGLIIGMVALASSNAFAAVGKLVIIEHNSTQNFSNQTIAL